MPRTLHRIPLGTHVSFEGDAQIYVVDQYRDVIKACEPDCDLDHDCYEEPYICVKKEIWTARPLSKLKNIFDNPSHVGRAATTEEKVVYES